MNNIILSIGIITAYTTYVAQYILNLGPYIAEGIPLVLGIIFFIKHIKFCELANNKNVRYYYIYLIYMVIISFIYIVFDKKNYLQLIFIYNYIPLLFVIQAKNVDIDCDSILLCISVCGALSSIIGILQFYDINTIVPTDINRSRGLSRSTLNYSSLLLFSFISSFLINLKYKFIFSAIIFAGLLASHGRGGIFSALIFLIIYNIKNYKYILLILIIITFTIYQLNDFIIEFINGNQLNSYSLLYNKMKYGLSYTNDPGNIERLMLYKRIIHEFDIVGLGIGSTGPAAQRFGPVTGYESYVLQMISQGGVFSILILYIYIIKIIKKINWDSKFNVKITAMFFSVLFMALAQQTFETPSVNITLWIMITVVMQKYNHEIK